MSLLDSIKGPEDIKKLDRKGLELLAEEVREFLIHSISKTGGHLASNLGVVELTTALYYVFDFPADKIVYDVGHQSYVHKLYSGRRDGFAALRKMGGMSGFPKTGESEFDCFNTGHSSTSISAALGLAKARDLKGGHEKVIALIGDGALTGGMALEALNNGNGLNTDIIVILNDNQMSISKNVGALAGYLGRITNRPGYFRFKSEFKSILDKIPKVGRYLKRFIKWAKDSIKYAIMPGDFFEEFGFQYFGPIDGHDFVSLINVLNQVKETKGPVLVHVYTKKGKGYAPAELKPDAFHGVSHFDVETGKILKNPDTKDFSACFGEALCRIAKDNDAVCGITAAMPYGTGMNRFAKEFRNRFFDVGIAEQHGVTFGAGLAAGGFIPVTAIYSSFLQRGFDQVFHDCCLQKLHMVFAVDRAGIVGEDGETHHGLYDIAYLTQMPNMTLMAPSSGNELSKMLDFAVNHFNGPAAIRYPRGYVEQEADSPDKIVYGKGRIVQKGTDIALFALGKMVSISIEAAELLEREGYSVTVCDLRFAKPLDETMIRSQSKGKRVVVSLEDGTVMGGIGEKIKNIVGGNVLIKAFPDECIPHGSVKQLFEKYHMDAKSIADDVLERVKHEGKIRYLVNQ